MQVVHYEDNHHIAMPLSTEPLDGTCSSAESHPMTKHANLNDITICSAHGIAVFVMANMMSLIRRPFTDRSCSALIKEKTAFSIWSFLCMLQYNVDSADAFPNSFLSFHLSPFLYLRLLLIEGSYGKELTLTASQDNICNVNLNTVKLQSILLIEVVIGPLLRWCK